MGDARLSRPLRWPALCLAALAACAEGAPEPPAETDGGGPEPAVGNFVVRSYERSFVFVAATGDSIFMVPWLMKSTARPGTVWHEARGWLARGGEWDAFYSDRWQTPSTRTPARILPHGDLKLVVREGDVVDAIIFDQGPRNLELTFGTVLTRWAGARGEAIEVLDGAAYISDQRVGGLILDMARTSTEGARTGTDWAFLASGDSLQILLTGEAGPGEDAPPAYHGWARLDFRDLQWPSMGGTWTEARAFQPARRDVPVAWSFESAAGELTVTLVARSAEIRAGEGDGPLLPVLGLFDVEGEASTEGRTFGVRGLFVHERGQWP